MTIPRLAYIVQLDLPGRPIKIGCTKNPWSRFDAFNHGTPVACRFVGLTLNGIEREKEMLAATRDRVVKGEWRYETPALLKLLSEYHALGEWFTHQPEKFDGEDISKRVVAASPDCAHYILQRKIAKTSIGYHWASEVLKRTEKSDPALGANWAGFHPALTRPSLQWPDSPLSIAA